MFLSLVFKIESTIPVCLRDPDISPLSLSLETLTCNDLRIIHWCFFEACRSNFFPILTICGLSRTMRRVNIYAQSSTISKIFATQHGSFYLYSGMAIVKLPRTKRTLLSVSFLLNLPVTTRQKVQSIRKSSRALQLKQDLDISVQVEANLSDEWSRCYTFAIWSVISWGKIIRCNAFETSWSDDKHFAMCIFTIWYRCKISLLSQ